MYIYVYLEMMLEDLDGRARAWPVFEIALRLDILVWIGRAPRLKIAAMRILVCLGPTWKCKRGFWIDVPCVEILELFSWVYPVMAKHAESRAPVQENQGRA